MLEMVSKSGFVGQHYSSRAVVCHSSPSLEGHGLSNVPVSSSSSYSTTPSLHRFELGGLGAHMDSHMGSGFRTVRTAHQYARDEDSIVGPASFCNTHQWSFSVVRY